MNDAYRLEELRAAIASAQVTVPAVSGWSVGMHVQHCCLAMIGTCGVLTKSEPPPPPSRPPVIRVVVFTTGRIIRGRGQAPERALPQADISPAELTSLLEEAGRQVAAAGNLEPERWFKHFMFGVLKRDDALKFLRIHNRHHLRIVSDIVSAQKGRST
ncbi:MAG TPA: DUF1569 domain-containing protein [Candidatus Krumholzibacteria bacterium]|nr:DUF1569 domain-containing protein [Candidatus Krumholzibacteria bacterium]